MLTKKQQKAINAIRRSREFCSIHQLTFAPLPEEYKPAMQSDFEQRFRCWWSSWIEPQLRILEGVDLYE